MNSRTEKVQAVSDIGRIYLPDGSTVRLILTSRGMEVFVSRDSKFVHFHEPGVADNIVHIDGVED